MALRNVAPINSTFLAVSMLGFIISAYLVFPKTSIQTSTGSVPFDGATWGFTFMLIFVLMFIASMISMRRASPDEQLRR